MDIRSVFFADWQSLARVLLVGVPAYILLVVLLQIGGKHSLAKTNAYGLVVTVALGSVLASSVLTKDVSLADGVLSVALLLVLQYLLATIVGRWKWAGRLLTQRPALLLREGRLLTDALRRECVTEAEVLAAVRSNGLDSLERVGAVVLETDGSFSVVPTLGDSPSALKDVY